VTSDTHPADRRAGRRLRWRATHVRTGLHRGLHRARGEATRAVEGSHGPIEARVRPRRGVPSLATGQRRLDRIEVAQAIRRGPIGAAGGSPATRHVASPRARPCSGAWPTPCGSPQSRAGLAPAAEGHPVAEAVLAGAGVAVVAVAASKVEERSARTSSASRFTVCRGWPVGTRSSRSMKAGIVICGLRRPRTNATRSRRSSRIAPA
jgi:hypothetical protein